MQTKILEKCLLELNQKEPNISYLKGMLETLIDMSGGNTAPAHVVTNIRGITETLPIESIDPILAQYEKGPIGKITTE